MNDIIEDLRWRGLLVQSTDLDALSEAFNSGPVTFYCGYDPTASSLHLGHLVQLLTMRRLQMAGHKPIALVGGATGLIGDPRMSGERVLNDESVVAQWVDRLTEQISHYLSFEGDHAARVVSNLDWTKDLTALQFLRDIGKHFRVGRMIAKDTVARRLESDQGISYTEFSYQILQSYDFLQLYRQFGCVLQTGGNDQWGNLSSGVEFVRKVEQASLHAMTTPLITKADGTKFGKTEGGAIWIDPDLTSPYAFYQFWLNTDDRDVIGYLKVFTFLTRDEIEALAVEVAERPGARAAQQALATEVTTLVHGATACRKVEVASQAIFGRGDLTTLDAELLGHISAEIPSARVSSDQLDAVTLLTAAGLAESKGAARRTIKDGGAYVNNTKVINAEAPVATEAELLPGRWLAVRRGRKSVALVQVDPE